MKKKYNDSLTEQQQLYVTENYTNFSKDEMAKYLGVSGNVVKTFCSIMSLKITKEQKGAIVSRLAFKRLNSAQFDDFLKQNYLELNYNDLAKSIGKSDTFVRNRLNFLGLKVPEDVKAQRVVDSYFKKGNVSFNKGVSITEWMTEEQRENFLKNKFKKGNVPHNAKEVGYESVVFDKTGRPYYMIKILGEKKLQYKHRVIWEEANGLIPKGYNVQFKDKNTLNCVLENLYLISRSEQMIENTFSPESIGKRMFKMSPEEIEFTKKNVPALLEAKSLQLKLKRQLKKIGNNEN